jgi:hypothetical protein
MRLSGAKDVVKDDEQAVRNCHGCLIASASTGNAVELSRDRHMDEVTVRVYDAEVLADPQLSVSGGPRQRTPACPIGPS